MQFTRPGMDTLKTLGTPFGVMLLLLGLDQASKIWVRAYVPLHQSTNLIPNLIDLTYVENRGVSWSIMADLSDMIRVPLLVGISLVAVALLAYYWLKHRATMNRWTDAAFILILPGAVGNLIDRVTFGSVTDYFHFRFYDTSFFVNNIADIWISMGVVAYMVGAYLETRKK